MEEKKEHYNYDQAFAECVEYFEGDELAANVFLSKYALRDNDNNLLEKTPTDMHWRIAKEFARIEKKKYKNTKIQPLTEEEIFSYLDHFKRIVPQGSLMYGIGNPYQYVTLSNCYVIDSPLDSYSGIMHTDEQLVQISKRRGGCGLDISNLRPSGTATTNAAKTSTGIIPFMERFSNSIREVGQAGRRGALLISLSVHHPEVLEFTNIKKDLTKVTGANISIKLTDDFLNAVKNDEEYEQRWPVDSKTPQISQMVDAKKVWDKIIQSAWSCLPADEQVICKNESGDISLISMESIVRYIKENHIILALSFNFKNNKLEWKKIINAFQYPSVKNFHKITLSHGKKILLTEDHVVYRINKNGIMESVEAKDICIGDKMACAKNNGLIGKHVNTIDLSKYLDLFSTGGNCLIGESITDILKNDNVKKFLGYYASGKYKKATSYSVLGYLPVEDFLMLKNNSTIPIDLIDMKNIFFSPSRQPDLLIPMHIEIDQDLSFIFGLWLAEGSLHKNGLRFHINTKEYNLYKQIFENICTRFQCNHKLEIFDQYTCVYLNSVFLSKLFVALGFLRDSIKDIPNFIFNLQEKILGAFVAGIVSGDGTVSKDILRLNQSNENILISLSAILRTYGIITSIRKKHSGGNKIIQGKSCTYKDNYELSFSKYSNCTSRRLFRNYLNFPKFSFLSKNTKEKDNILIPYEIDTILFDKIFRKSYREYVNFNTIKNKHNTIDNKNIFSYLNSDMVLYKVKTNEKIDFNDRFVYDITVEENHNFVLASGIIVSNSAEPGLLFFDTIIKESPADCYAELGFRSSSTNPCGEVPLNPGDSCRLLVLNMLSYVKNPFTKDSFFDYEAFCADAKIAQRLMDSLVDLEEEAIKRIIDKVKKDPEPNDIKMGELNLWEKILETCLKGRRTGTGLTALGDTLAALGIKYASDESIEVVEKIYRTLKLGCYRSSVDIAKSIGAFPVWNHELEKDNPFLLRIKDEDPKLWDDMKKYGRRNISLLTSSPCGSISLLTQTTSGIEPAIFLSYTRRKKINPHDTNIHTDFTDHNGDSWQEFQVYHPQIKTWTAITGETDITKSPWYGCCAQDLNWTNRIKLQAAAQRNICHSISSTLNLPNNVSVEEVANIYETAWQEGLKGITVYRDGCRTGVMVNKKDKPPSITKTEAPKRSKELFCDIYHASVKGQEYIVAVGLFDNEPYEVFAGKNGQVSKSIKSGIIRKAKRGCYQLLSADNQVILESIIDLETPEEEAMTRIISTALRHGADISFIVHQLEKTKGELTSFAKSVARTLKKYVKDGTKVSGEECEKCGDKLIRQDGCILCKSCGFSKCS